jgi:hypothetical protein
MGGTLKPHIFLLYVVNNIPQPNSSESIHDKCSTRRLQVYPVQRAYIMKIMILQAFLEFARLVAQVSAVSCRRDQINSAVDDYIQALHYGRPDYISMARNFTYTENEVFANVTTGTISQNMTLDISRSLFDTTACAGFVETTAATNKHPYVINAYMLISDEKVTLLQLVIADSGDWLFNATSHLYWTKQENWTEISKEKQDSRVAIKAAADAYLDSWADGSVKVPYGTPCARLEGGAYTGNKNTSTNSCHMPEFPKPFAGASNRRYVIDEEMGGVGIFDNFPFIDTTRPEGTPSVNFLRIEGGNIRYIHETTICATRNCGR